MLSKLKKNRKKVKPSSRKSRMRKSSRKKRATHPASTSPSPKMGSKTMKAATNCRVSQTLEQMRSTMIRTLKTS